MAQALRQDDKENMALMSECSASGLCIAIAAIEGSTPMQIEDELTAEIKAEI